MTRDDVKQAIVSALIEIQVSSGREVGQIVETTCLIGDLEGFDSLNTIEAVVMISDTLGQEIDLDSFLDKNAGHPPHLSTIIDRICHQIGIQ